MIRGLQITLSGEELSRRIGERIRIHEVADTRVRDPRVLNATDVRYTAIVAAAEGKCLTSTRF